MRTSDVSARPVLVTGASKGIGRAIALRLGRSGHPITVHDGTDHAGAELTAKQVAELGGTARVVQFDIADRDATGRALNDLIERNGAFWG